MSGPSQPKVEGEQWSDERIAGFLELRSLEGNSDDYHVLREAYQHMVFEFFERFISMFVNAGRDINGLSAEGETILDRVSQHRKSKDFADLLIKNGAKLSTEL